MTIKTLFTDTPITAVLLFAIVAVFLIQLLTGVNVDQPSTQSLVKWGANALPLTLTDEPWRLISSAFLHIGLMHLLFNAFALYIFGQAAEQTFGSVKFLFIFLLSAIGGNLLNNYVTWWQISHNNLASLGVSAGASGGIMGLGTALLCAALYRYLMPKKNKRTQASYQANEHLDNNPLSPQVSNRQLQQKQQLKSLAIIMGINLVYGFIVPGIDNAGHIGGAITGAVLAISVLIGLRLRPSTQHSRTTMGGLLPWFVIALISTAFGYIWYDLHQQLLSQLTL